MLDAAVCGDVFASPSQVQVYQAIKATASDKGTLLIIKNYSGDMMNFQSAAYLAEMDNITVDYVKLKMILQYKIAYIQLVVVVLQVLFLCIKLQVQQLKRFRISRSKRIAQKLLIMLEA